MNEALWSRAELRGPDGVDLCWVGHRGAPRPCARGALGAAPCSQIPTRGDGRSGRTQGPVQPDEGWEPTRERGGTAFPHPQCHIPQRHSPGWSRLCSARICCTGQRQKALGQGRTPPQSPGPLLNPPAPTQLFRTAPERDGPSPRPFLAPTPGSGQCPGGHAAVLRAEGCLYTMLRDPLSTCSPTRDPQHLPVGAACSILTLGRAGWAKTHGPCAPNTPVCATVKFHLVFPPEPGENTAGSTAQGPSSVRLGPCRPQH